VKPALGRGLVLYNGVNRGAAAYLA